MTAPPSESHLRFGAYEVDRRSGEFRKSGVRIRIQEQPFRVLIALLERAGEVVTREELRPRLWPDDTFVDFEHSLNAAVNKLRETLGDSASHPRFVETVPRRGYRFIYPVTPPAGPVAGQGRRDETQIHPFRRRLVLGAVVLAVIALAAAFFGKLRDASNNTVPQLTAIPFTSVPGLEMYPAFSPGGEQLAYCWDGPQQDNLDIYIKMVGGAEPFRLTTDPADEYGSAWSPDGRSIAFLRQIDNTKASVRIVSPLGDGERDLGEIGVTLKPGTLIQGFYLAWTPDSNWLVVQDQSSLSEASSLWLLSAKSGERRRLTEPAPLGDFSPAVSPNGRSMVFVRIGSAGFTLCLLTMDERYNPVGRSRTLVSDRRQKYGPVFSADGKRVIYGSGEWSDPGLWEVAVAPGSTPRRLPFVGQGGETPTLSGPANRLAYSRFTREWNIWKIERSGPGRYSAPGKVIPSTRFEKDPQLSPDGSMITFASTRSGYLEIWVANSDGSGLQQLTFFEGPGGGSPRWSPDGEFIAFDSMVDGNMNIHVIPLRGGAPRRITDHPLADDRPSWSHGGKWIYFASLRAGGNQVFKVPVEGGDAVQLTREGGGDPFESPDGEYVYFVKDDETLWRIPAKGGEETQVCPSCRVHSGNSTLSVVEGGVYFFDPRPDPDGRYAIRYLDLATGQVEPVVQLDRPQVNGLGATPDGRAIVYSKMEQEKADIMLVENFH